MSKSSRPIEGTGEAGHGGKEIRTVPGIPGAVPVNSANSGAATFPASKPLPKTGAELVAYWQSENVIGFRGDITDAPTEARRLREEAETERGQR